MATKLKDLVVATGSYTDRQGNEKKRFRNVGALWENDNGQFLMLDPCFNFAAVPRDPGRDNVLVSMFDVREKSGDALAGAAGMKEDVPF
jgi:hypothetical protein